MASRGSLRHRSFLVFNRYGIFDFFDDSCTSWLLKLCAKAAAEANALNEAEKDSSSSSSSSLTPALAARKLLSLGGDSVVRVGRNVSFDQAVDILNAAGRTPDKHYSHELLKVYFSHKL